MAQQTIDIGSAPNDGTGDPIRDAFDKCNDNFTELYTGLTGLLDFKGSTDASANPNYPAASKGDFYVISVAGKIGGASGIDVEVGDAYFAKADNAGGNQATVGTSWTVIQGNITGGVAGAIEVLDEGVSETATLVSLDFVGAGVTASDDGSGNVTVTIAGGGGGVDVEDEGVAEASGATVLNFTGAGVAATDVGGGQVDIDIPGGGGSVGWTLVDQTGAPAGGSSTWTFSTNVAQVDITGLGSFNELLVIARGLSTSVAGVRRIQVSTDNGATFDTTAANYIGIAETGLESNAPGVSISNHTTNSGSARTLVSHIKNLKGPVKYAYGNNTIGNSHNLYVGSINDIDAIRINNNTGGNITAGTIYVFAR